METPSIKTNRIRAVKWWNELSAEEQKSFWTKHHDTNFPLNKAVNMVFPTQMASGRMIQKIWEIEINS